MTLFQTVQGTYFFLGLPQTEFGLVGSLLLCSPGLPLEESAGVTDLVEV